MTSYLFYAVEYLVLQGHFTVKVDKNLIMVKHMLLNWYSYHNNNFLNLKL